MKWLILTFSLSLAVGCTEGDTSITLHPNGSVATEVTYNKSDLTELRLALGHYQSELHVAKKSIQRLTKEKAILNMNLRSLRKTLVQTDRAQRSPLRERFKTIKLRRIAAAKAIKTERLKLRQTISHIRTLNDDVKTYVANADKLNEEQQRIYEEIEQTLANLEVMPQKISQIENY